MREANIMKKTIMYVSLALFGMFMFSACGGLGVVRGDLLKKENTSTVNGIFIDQAYAPGLDSLEYKGYQDKNNAKALCSTQIAMHEASSEALKYGYSYFSLTFKKGSTPKPLAIVSSEQISQYCAAPYFDKDSNLLDDKCKHIGLGSGTLISVSSIEVQFFKKRNPFLPLWDARRTLKETEKTLLSRCYGGDRALLNKSLARTKID